MMKFEDVINVMKNDEAMSKVVNQATLKDSLSSIGLDSLDVMMLAHELGEGFGMELELNTQNSIDDILNIANDKLNSIKKNKGV
ncbi:acyl carrier protein [Shouchella hunanensis]|uniref:Acyl carrier protein n=1 Tax=Shouchella hunanensis TaxID=766894 RepID=A0ABY7W5P1_9BACI|nr:acyl carrier protein [Shouchella hunanensis]WDF02040.1 acyl carrier protein [Shouchella hunanensis]